MINVFLIFSSSIIHAQGNFPFWQYPNFYSQYGQQWGIQAHTPGYFSLFNPISQYGQQWGLQSYIPGNFRSYNSIPQPWSSQLRLSSESPTNLNLIHYILFIPYTSDALWNLNWDLEDTDITLEMPDDGESINADIGEMIGLILPNYRDN